MKLFSTLMLAPLLLTASDDFAFRLDEYAKTRSKAVAGMPKLSPTASPEQILGRQRALAERIRSARSGAQQGNIFTPPVAKRMRELIAAALAGPEAAAIKQSLARGEPVNVQIAVNQEYPPEVPLQSTPPSLLGSLPKLPANFQYRLAGSNLVLLDVDANLIVDYIPNAMPK